MLGLTPDVKLTPSHAHGPLLALQLTWQFLTLVQRETMPAEHRSQLSNRLYAPEGRYALFSERLSGLHYFSDKRSTKLTFVDMLLQEEGYHVLFNVGEHLHIAQYSQTGKVCCLTGNCRCLLLVKTQQNVGCCMWVWNIRPEHDFLLAYRPPKDQSYSLAVPAAQQTFQLAMLFFQPLMVTTFLWVSS